MHGSGLQVNTRCQLAPTTGAVSGLLVDAAIVHTLQIVSSAVWNLTPAVHVGVLAELAQPKPKPVTNL